LTGRAEGNIIWDMNIILFGQAPLPIGSNSRNTAPGFRAWHFAQALSDAGHVVHLVAIDTTPGAVVMPKFMQVGDNTLLYYFGESQIVQDNTLENLLREIEPEVAIGASIYPSYLAALNLPASVPFWADMFGSPIAEGQAKAYVYQDDRVIEPFVRFERTVLARADKFSAVSNPQKYAIIGELGLMGRLKANTYGYEFVHTVPATTDEQVLEHSERVLRGKIVPEDAFVVLWSGGFNTWTDVETLFEGLEKAIVLNPKIHFVSTGGALPPHDVKTYARFEQLVNGSKSKPNFHLLGWLPLEQLHNYYYEANVGIVLDKWSYEGVLGSRTRLTEWLKYGLPAITTLTAEITKDLAAVGGVLTFAHGDSEELTQVIVSAAQEPEKLKEMANNGRKFVLAHYNSKIACAPLLAWLEKPVPAPDNTITLAEGSKVGEFLEAVNAQEASSQKKLLAALAHLEEKNYQIAELEKWAKQMEIALKRREANLLVKTKERLGNLQAKLNSIWRERTK
jgi:glycosyltransferase involved in cell wall biosynthesis